MSQLSAEIEIRDEAGNAERSCQRGGEGMELLSKASSADVVRANGMPG